MQSNEECTNSVNSLFGKLPNQMSRNVHVLRVDLIIELKMSPRLVHLLDFDKSQRRTVRAGDKDMS